MLNNTAVYPHCIKGHPKAQKGAAIHFTCLRQQLVRVVYEVFNWYWYASVWYNYTDPLLSETAPDTGTTISLAGLQPAMALWSWANNITCPHLDTLAFFASQLRRTLRPLQGFCLVLEVLDQLPHSEIKHDILRTTRNANARSLTVDA